MDKEQHDYDIMRLGFEGEEAITEEIFSKYGRNYEPKRIIIQEGAGDREVFLIISGRVVVTEKMHKGSYRVLNSLGPGEIFGEMALLDNKERSATLISATQVKLLAFTPENFEKMFKTHPRWTFKLLGGLAKRLQAAFQQVEKHYGVK